MGNIKNKYNVGDIHGVQEIMNLFRKNNRLHAYVKCTKCGKEKDVYADSLYNEKFNSCQCQLRTHGMSKTKIYSVYANIKYRCYNSNHHEFHNYGGKGIKMGDEWLGENGFVNFYQWALDNGYKEGLTIDRIDSDKDYEPSNCQWITRGANTTKSNKICQHRKANKGRYYGISPDGVRYEFDNAAQFSREHELSDACIRNVANGKNKIHKGWKFGFISEEDVA